MKTCECGCGQEFEPNTTGSPQRFYNNACKQRYYRKQEAEKRNVTLFLQASRKVKPVLRYPGAKWSLAQWIVDQLPEHTQYLEPYCGSAAVFLSKKPAEHEIINDMNGDIVNLFRVLRSHSLELIAQVNLTPWSREEYEASYEPCDDAIERARRFLVRCWQAHGTTTCSQTGWRNVGSQGNGSTTAVWKRLPERLAAIANRLKDAEIECKPAIDLIAKYNTEDCLIYADPPYVLSTRAGKLYSHEMTTKDHEELLTALLRHRGPVVLSGYAHPLYDNALSGWQRKTMPALAEHGKRAEEVLWLNPKASGARQFSMFELAV